MQDLQDVKSSLILTVVMLVTAAVHSLVKIQQKLTVLLLMQLVMLRKTS